MNILQITKYFYPAISFGGPVQCTYHLSKYLVSRGHKVTVYATDALDISSNTRIQGMHHSVDGIEVFYFRNLARSYGFFLSPSMIHILKENIEQFDVVHLHEYRTFQNIVFHFLNMRRIPYAMSCHGELFYNRQPWDKFILRKLFEDNFGRRIIGDASKLIALTQFERAQYLVGGVKKSRIAVIPNGVAFEDFSNPSSIPSLKQLYNIKEENIILYLGRINKDKGIDILLKAFALISKERDDIKLVLAGPDDGFSVILHEMIEELKLKPKVLFTGSLNRQLVAAAYNDCAVVVYASLQEGFPMVPLEAGRVGKPVIVTDIPSMNFVREGNFGLTVRYGNVAQLKEALETLLNNSEFSRKLGENGRNFVTANYDWQVVGKQIEDIYYTISSQPP